MFESFTDVSQLKGEVIKWIEKKIKSTVSGDVVNIIIEGHGDAKGRGLCLGPNRIFPQEMSDLTSKFRDGIQVNIITGACHSGAIADVISATGQKNRHVAAACAAEQVATAYKRSVSNRLRNSRFSQAFCQSLSRMKLPGVIQEHIVRLGEHETWMTAMCYRCISPNHADGFLSDSYTSYNEPNDITELVEHMIFRDKVDVVYDPAITASRRRIEYPSINEAILKVFRNWGPDKPYPYNNVKQEVQKLVEDEASKCDSNTPFQADSGLIEELVFQKACEPDFVQMLKTLYWRGRIQNAIMDTFTVLCNRGFLALECLQQPINFYNVSKSVSMLAWLISCYEGPQQEKSLDPPPFTYHNDQFDAPYIWLATMILRGSTDIKKLFETVTLCQYLGGLNMVAFETWRKYSEMTDFVINPNEMAAQSIGPGYFGFWLPNGIQAFGDEAAQKFRAHINRFNRIESVFRSFFELPMEELWLESEQEVLFNQFPRKMPGWKKSGDWTTVFASSANTGLDTPPSTTSSP